MDITTFSQRITEPGYVTLVTGATARTARTILRRDIDDPSDAPQAIAELCDAAAHSREHAWIRYYRRGGTTPTAIVQVEEADDPHHPAGGGDVPHALVSALVTTNSTLQTLLAHQADQLLRIVEATSERMFDAGRAIGAMDATADPPSGLAGPAAILERVAERLIPAAPTSPDQLWAMFQALPPDQRQTWIEGILGVVERATGGGEG